MSHLGRRLLRRAAWTAGLGTGLYLLDKHAYSSTLQRNLRTVWSAALISLDFKLNFPEDPEDVVGVNAVHARVARRMFNLCHRNGRRRGRGRGRRRRSRKSEFSRALTTFHIDRRAVHQVWAAGRLRPRPAARVLPGVPHPVQ